MNKKGFGPLLLLFFVIIGMLLLAFGASFLIGMGNNLKDEVVPIINGLGVVSGSGINGDNMTETANYVVTPVTVIMGSLGWVGGIGYVLCLLLTIGLAISFKMTGEKWLVIMFLLLAVAAIMISILISNTYQDFYDGGDDLAAQLHSQVLLSWVILYSPLITTLIMFICGIIMFTGPVEGGYV